MLRATAIRVQLVRALARHIPYVPVSPEVEQWAVKKSVTHKLLGKVSYRWIRLIQRGTLTCYKRSNHDRTGILSTR